MIRTKDVRAKDRPEWSDNGSETAKLSGSPYSLQDLPPHKNELSWQIDPSRSALLLHDMQRYFVRSLPDDPRQSLVRNTTRLLRWARSMQIPVFFTAQPGDMTPEQRGLLFDFWGPGMQAVQNDKGIITALTPATQEVLLTKWRYSAFTRTSLGEQLADAVRDQLIVTGVFASIGIQTTAVESYSRDIETFVPQDAVADFNVTLHTESMAYLSRCCARVMTTEEVVQSG